MPKLQEIAVSLAVDYLLPPIKKAVNSVMEVPKDAADMNDKLDGIQAMIHDADKMAAAEEGNSRDGLKAKVKQLVETSFCMEDIVDEYIIHEERQLADDPGCASLPCKAVDFVKTTASRLQFAYMNQDVKSEFHGIKEGNKSEDCSQIQSSGGNQNITFDNLRMAPLFLKEAEVVGFDSPRDTLERWLKEGREKLTVVSVVGMGGSGKTTLAKKVFDKVQTHFTRHVWITVSQSYTIEGLLLKFLEAEKGKDSSQSVYSTMDKASYVVVFDDVWNENFWEEMKFALVDVENGSRIIITTRHREVAESCRTSSLVQVHELLPLTDDKSFELFCKTAFGSELDGHCPNNLKGISTEIVKKCEGLPLAIVATGGLLSRKSRDAREWLRFRENLSSELGKHPKLTPVKKILGLSYYDLPYHLKPCFLYFGIYPEDYEVECEGLILQWVAQGFVKSDEAAQTLEEVAEKYLNELIQRSLVQVSSVKWSDKINSCRVHDVVREMIREKNQDLSFCHSASERGNLSKSGMIRHLTIASDSNNLMGSVESSNIRSLHVFSDEELSESLVKSVPTKYRLLRVLQFEGASMYHYDPMFDSVAPIESLGDLSFLRYLSFRSYKINYLPKLIGELHNLETLDLRYTRVRKMRREIYKLKNSPLQHRQPFTSSSPHNFLDHSPLPLSSSYSPFPLSFTFQRPAPMLSTPLRFKRYCASPSNNNNNNLSDPPLTTQFPHLDGFRFPVSSGFSQFFQPSVLDSDRGVSSSSSSLAFQPKLKLPLSQYYKPPEEQDIKLDIEFNDPSFQSSSTGLLGDLLFEAQAMASGKNSKKRGYLSLNEGNNWYVVSIDPRRVYVKDPNDVQLKTIRVSNSGPNGEEYAWYQCTVNGGREGRPVGAYELAKAVEELGAGEILRNCIDCDGQGKGFDVDLIKLISDAVSIPVIASGGAGAPQHFSEGNDFDLLTIHLLSDNSGFQMDSGIGDLTSLQTLRAVDLRHNTEEVVKGLEKLTQLRESEEMVGWGGIKSLRRSGRGRFWRKERLERKLGLRRNHWLLELFGTANLATTPPLFAAVVRSPPVAATTTTVINYFLESWSLMEGMANISDDASNGENGFLAMFGGDESGGGGSGGVGSSGDQGGGNVEDVALKKGPWTTAEDVILMDYVTKNGEGNWNAVQRNTGLNRCGKSCRHRWANHLRPNLKKGAFSPEEEKLIVDLHAQFGNKWARMAALDQTPPKAGSPFNTIVPQHQPPPTTPFPCLTPTGSNPNIATSFELFNQNQQHHQQQQYQYQQQQYQQHPLSPTASHHSLLSSPLQHRQPFTSSSPHNFLDHSPLPLSSSSSPSPLSFTFQRPAPMLSTPLRFKRYCASPSYNNNLSDPPLTTQFPHLDGLRFPVSSGFSQFFQPSLLDSDRGVSSSSSSLAFQPKLELPLSQYYKPPEEQDIKLDIEFNDPSFQSSSSGLMGDLLFEAQAMASGKNSKKRGYLSLNEGNNVFEDFPSSSLYGPSSTSEPKPKEEAPDFSKFMNGDLSSLLTVIPSSNMQGHEWHNNSAREMSNVQSSVSGMTDDNFGLDIKPIASLFPLSNTTNHDENQGCYSWDNLPGLC
ncbi:Disease resistance protein RPM1 [Glycine soja]